MNKIIVENEVVTLLDSDELIEVELSDKLDIFDVVKMKIKILGNTDIFINYKSDESKLDIVIEVLENTISNIYEIKEEKNIKVQYRYFLDEGSNLTVHKFYDCDKVKELDIVNLNGKNATINYKFSTICTDSQKYDLMVYHNSPNTISNIINKGVNINKGELSFNVTGVVYNGIIDCELNQNNRIVTLNDNKCNINPNLLIEENDVIANHSALIGRFSEEELFYLMSRGICRDDATKLLVKGFLNESEETEKIIDKYWR